MCTSGYTFIEFLCEINIDMPHTTFCISNTLSYIYQTVFWIIIQLTTFAQVFAIFGSVSTHFKTFIRNRKNPIIIFITFFFYCSCLNKTSYPDKSNSDAGVTRVAAFLHRFWKDGEVTPAENSNLARGLPKHWTCQKIIKGSAFTQSFKLNRRMRVEIKLKALWLAYQIPWSPKYYLSNQKREILEAFNKHLYYIPINVISLDTVDFTECDPMLRITTLWFSESISPLSETDDVVHNVFLNTQCMRYCDVFIIAP